MAFNIPIQERDTVDLQQPNLPQIQTAPLTQPIRGETGKQIDVIAEMMNKQAEQLRDKTHKYAKMDLENKRDQIIDSNMTEALAAKGENALVQSDRAKKKIKEQTDKLLLNIPDEYKAEFNLAVQGGINRADKTLNGHQYKEINDVHEKTAKERANYATNMFALATANPDEAQKNLEIIDQVAEVEARRKLGITTDLNVEPSVEVQQAIAIQKQYARSGAVTQAIELMASNEDMVGAKQYLNTYASELTATDRMKVNAAISKGKSNEKYSAAKRLMEDAVSHFPNNPAQAMHYIQAGTQDGEIFNHAKSMYESQINFAESQRKRDLEKSQAWAQEEIRKNPANFDAIIKRTPLEDRYKLQEYAKKVSQGESIPRDNREYTNLMHTYENFPSEFSKIDLRSKTNVLPKDDIAFFTSLQKEVREPTIGKTSYDSMKDITARVVSEKVGTKFAYSSDDYLNGKADIQSKAGDVFAELQRTLPDRTSKAEFRKKFEEELAMRTQQTVRKEPKWFGLSSREVVVPKSEQTAETKTTQFYRNNPALVERVTIDLTRQLGYKPSITEIGDKLKKMEYLLSTQPQ